MPSDVDIDEHLSGSFGSYEGNDDVAVQARILKSRAFSVREESWHPSQQVTMHKDGSLTVHFRLSSTLEFKAWILSFGADARVLMPDSLREEVAEELAAMAAAYEEKESLRQSSEKTTRAN